MIRTLILLGIVFGMSSQAHAAKGGWSLGANLGISTASQDDLNTLIKRARSRTGVNANTSELGNAWDFSGYIGYRFDWIQLQFRPSYFTHSEEGSGATGTYDYSASGFILMPMIRFYMLESDIIGLYSQFGVGFGFLSGEIQEGSASVEFSGSDFGYQVGLGVEFCFFGSSHCVALESNLRAMGLDRVEADSASGTFASDSLTQAAEGQEVEMDGRDLSISATGLVASLGYTFYFN